MFALPLEAHGAGFPDRDLLLLCAYAVVIVTLVGQGLTLAPLLRVLGLGAARDDERRLRAAARVAAIDSALRRLEEIGSGEEPHSAVVARMEALYRDRRRRAQERLSFVAQPAPESSDEEAVEAFGRVRRALLDAEREELVRWRDGGRITDAGFRALQRELDHEEGILSLSTRT